VCSGSKRQSQAVSGKKKPEDQIFHFSFSISHWFISIGERSPGRNSNKKSGDDK
jgi:hypothetical protein